MFIALVDECTDGIDNCDANATCTDTDLSFTCACNAGYAGNGTSCAGDYYAVNKLKDHFTNGTALTYVPVRHVHINVLILCATTMAIVAGLVMRLLLNFVLQKLMNVRMVHTTAMHKLRVLTHLVVLHVLVMLGIQGMELIVKVIIFQAGQQNNHSALQNEVTAVTSLREMFYGFILSVCQTSIL